jgi:hypothetical protein
MVDEVDEVLHRDGTIVIGNRDPYFAKAVGRLNMAERVVDLVRLEANGRYDGICW